MWKNGGRRRWIISVFHRVFPQGRAEKAKTPSFSVDNTVDDVENCLFRARRTEWRNIKVRAVSVPGSCSVGGLKCGRSGV